MLKIINKIYSAILIAIMVSGIFAPVFFVKAAASFNNNSQDKPTLRISNYTKNSGCSGCWSTYASADAGDIVSFDVYYHNTSSETANQTRASVILPSGNFSSRTIYGSVWSNNSSLIAQSGVSLNLTSSQTLTFISGSARWYPNQSLSEQTLPSGQNGSEITSSSGLNIGDIALGWETQGHIIFRAQVSNNNNAVSSSQTNSNFTNQPTVFTNSAGNVSLNSAALNASVNPNGSSTNVWFEYGATSNYLSNITPSQLIVGSSNANNAVSYFIYNLSANNTYYFRAVAQNSAGTTYGNVLSFATFTSPAINWNPTVTTLSANSILTNSANLNSWINPNNSFTTAWFEYGTSSGSFPYISSSQSIGSGNATLSPYSNIVNLSPGTTYYFRAVAQNSYGTSYGSVLSFTTAILQTNNLAPFVTTNSATAITRTSANLNGTINPNGSSTNAWFEYGTSAGSLTDSTGQQNIGSGVSYAPITLSISNLSNNTVYYFRPVAQNYAGITRGAINSFVTGTASNTVNVASLNITNQSLNNINNENQGAKAIITAPVQMSVLEISEIIENLTLPNGNEISNFSDIGHKLKYATKIKNTGSQALYGLKINTQIPSSLKYLESMPKANYDSIGNIIAWNVLRLGAGETITLSFITEIQSGLNSTITNQFQIYIPAKNLNVYSNNTSTYISKQKPVSLKFTVDENEVKSGNALNYSIIIKNVNDFAVKNVLLSVSLPDGVELVESDFPVSSRNKNNLIIDLGSVAENQEIVRKLSVKVRSNVKANDILTAIAIVNYQDFVGNIQPIVLASASSTVVNSMNLSASIFGGFGSISLAGWAVLGGILAFIFVASSLVRAAIKRLNGKIS